MASAGGIRAGQAFIELYTNDSKLLQGLAQAQSRLKAFADTVKGIGTGMMAAGTAITAPILASAKVFMDAGDAMDKMSKRTGMSVEMLSTLSHGAKLSGTSIEEVEVGVKKMQKALVDASQGGKTTVMALNGLGLSAKELLGLSVDQQFEIIGSALAKVENPTMRAAVAMELFGKSGTSLLPLAASLPDLRSEIERVGGAMSGETATSAAELDDAYARLEKSGKGILMAIGGAVAPALRDAATAMTENAVAAKKWIKDHSGLITTALKVGTVLVGVGGGFYGFGMMVNAATTSLQGVRGAIGVFKYLSDVKWATNFAKIGSMLNAVAFSKFASGGVSAFSLIGNAFTGLGSKLSGAGGLGALLASGFRSASGAAIGALSNLGGALSKLPAIASAAFQLPVKLISSLPGLISAAAKAFDGFLGKTTIFTQAFSAIGAGIGALRAAFAAGGLTGVLGLLSTKIGGVFTAIGAALGGVTVSVLALVAVIAAAVIAVGYDIKLALDIRAAKKIFEETTQRVKELNEQLLALDKRDNRGAYMDADSARKHVEEYVQSLIRAGKTREEVMAAIEGQRNYQGQRNEGVQATWKKGNAFSKEFYEGIRNESNLLRDAFAEAARSALENYEGMFRKVERDNDRLTELQNIAAAEELGLFAKAIEKRKEALTKFNEWRAQQEQEQKQRAASFELEKLGENDPMAAMDQAGDQYAEALKNAAAKIEAAQKAIDDAIARPDADVRKNAQGEVEVVDNERMKKAVQDAEDAQKLLNEREQTMRGAMSKYIEAQHTAMEDQKEFYKRVAENRRREGETRDDQTFGARLRVAESHGSRTEGQGLKTEAEKAFRDQIKRAKELQGEAQAAYEKAYDSGSKNDLESAKNKAEEATRAEDRIGTLRERLMNVSEALAGDAFNKKFDVAGTFNASRLDGMGLGSTAADRTAKAAEEISKLVKWIWQIQNAGDGSAFGY